MALKIACQGLPDGQCPSMRCDSSVHNTIYDLFLCNDCERSREIMASNKKQGSATTDNSSTSGTLGRDMRASTIANTKAASANKSKAKANQAPSTPVSPLVTLTTKSPTQNANKSKSDNNTNNAKSNADQAGDRDRGDDIINGDYQKQIDTLKQQVELLTTQLNFVLSFIGITDQSISTIQQSVAVITNSKLVNGDDTTYDTPTEATTMQLSKPTMYYSTAVRQPATTRSHHSTLKESIVAAVYIDQSVKNRRASTIIVSGLQSTPASDDQSLFAGLCENEFGFRPDITTTKRLGQHRPGKIQPLLVALRHIDQAKQLVDSAKILRQSSDPTVKANVYINRNLTKAEADAAFQIREHRRQTALQRRVQQPSSIIADNKHHSGVGEISTLSYQATAPTSVLNADAAEFSASVPSPSLGDNVVSKN